MAAVASNVVMSFGLLTTTVAVLGAVEPQQSFITVCQGAFTNSPHEPKRLKQRMVCEDCGDVPFEARERAVETPQGIVLLTDEQREEVALDAAQWKKAMALRPHPAEQVLGASTWGEKSYYLVPNKGQGGAYAALLYLVQEHPELAFTCVWTPRTKQAVFRVMEREGILIMREIVAGDRLRNVPENDIPNVDPAMASMAEAVLMLEGVITDFALDNYADKGAEKLQEIVNAATPVPVAGATGAAAPASQSNPMAALQAMLDAQKAAAKPATKRGAKKAVAGA